MNFRRERVGKLIQAELGKLMLRETSVTDALVTITDVVVDDKLDRAEVKVSILPPAKEDEAIKSLVRDQGKLQYLLLRKMNIRPMPRIEFTIDRGIQNAAKVEKLLLEDQGE